MLIILSAMTHMMRVMSVRSVVRIPVIRERLIHIGRGVVRVRVIHRRVVNGRVIHRRIQRSAARRRRYNRLWAYPYSDIDVTNSDSHADPSVSEATYCQDH